MEDIEDIQDVLLRLESSLPICRICLDVSMEYIEFESPICVINGVEITYSDAFHQITSIVYELPDEIPTNLCSACGSDLLNTYLFLKRVENTNCILGKIKSLTKAGDNKTDEFVESLKVEILNDSKGGKCLNLWTSVKLENEIECALSESNKQTLRESECNTECSLESKADIKPMYDDAFDNKSPCHEEWFVGDDSAEICEIEKPLAENVGKNDSSDDSHIICTQYNCAFCKKDFKTKALLMIHINVHRDRRKSKNLSAIHKKISTKYQQWRKHKSVEGKKRKCPETKGALPRRSDKIKKSQVIQQTEASDFTCNFCGKKYLTAIGLKSHSRAHKERRFICHVCSKMCSTETTLKRHIDHIHLSDCKKYQCEDCGLVFKYPSYLKDHQRKHDTKSKYKCPFCDRSYCRKPQFDIHLRYHYNDYRYKCNDCNKGYATKSNLTDHIKSTHIKITYDCDKCDQKFKSVTGLKKHKYSHTGYPYNCPLCLLGQASRSGIKTHILGVHKGAITIDEFNKMFPLVHPKSGYRRPKLKSIE